MANADHIRIPESVETLDVEDRDRFIMVFDDVWQELKGKTALSVYMALKRRVNDDRKEWYGTHSTLSQESGVSPKTFQRCIEHLEEIGLVVTLRRFAPKGWDRKDGSRIVYSDRPGKGYEEIGKLYRIRFHVPVGKSDQAGGGKSDQTPPGKSDQTGGGKSDQTPPGKSDQTGGGKSDQQTYIPSDVDTSDIDTRSPLTPKGEATNAASPSKDSKTEEHPLPQNWQPDNNLWERMTKKHQQLNLHDELKKFRDYWHTRTDKQSRKKDWSRSWQNWLNKASAPPKYTPKWQQASDYGAQSLAQLQAEGKVNNDPLPF